MELRRPGCLPSGDGARMFPNPDVGVGEALRALAILIGAGVLAGLAPAQRAVAGQPDRSPAQRMTSRFGPRPQRGRCHEARSSPSSLGVVVLALFGGTLWFLWAKSRKPETVYQTESPKTADIVKKTVATGSVVPRQEVEIKPRVSGIVDELYVEPGKSVKNGDLIARIRLVPDMVNLEQRPEPGRPRAQIALDERAGRLRAQPAAGAGRHSSRMPRFQHFETALENAKAELEAAQRQPRPDPEGHLARIRRHHEHAGALDHRRHGARGAGQGRQLGDRDQHLQRRAPRIATVADMDDMIFQGKVDESEVGKLQRRA